MRQTLTIVAGICGLAVSAARAQQVYSDSQATRGAQVFRRVCSACHAASQFANPAFRSGWRGRPVYELFEQVRTTMPQDNPGRLRRQEYADVLAYVFKLNGLPAGANELPTDAESLRNVLFQPHDSTRR